MIYLNSCPLYKELNLWLFDVLCVRYQFTSSLGHFPFLLVEVNLQILFPLTETKIRPQLTSIIAASSGTMKADEVAQKTLNGIKLGSFIVACNLEGLLLSIATAGLSPQRSYLTAFVEVVTVGIVRVAALCFQWGWYRSIEKWHTQGTGECFTKWYISMMGMRNYCLVNKSVWNMQYWLGYDE